MLVRKVSHARSLPPVFDSGGADATSGIHVKQHVLVEIPRLCDRSIAELDVERVRFSISNESSWFKPSIQERGVDGRGVRQDSKPGVGGEEPTKALTLRKGRRHARCQARPRLLRQSAGLRSRRESPRARSNSRVSAVGRTRPPLPRSLRRAGRASTRARS